MLSQRTLSLERRDFDGTIDYPRFVELYNANYPDYSTSVEERRAFDESIDRSKYLFKRHSFIDKATGSIVAFGEVHHITDMFHPTKFGINIIVQPDRQGQGIGGTVYETLSVDLRDLRATTAWTQVKEDLTGQLRFYEHRGFKEIMRVWESRLTVSSVDPAEFSTYTRRVASQGIRVATLAEERTRDLESTKKLHRLVQTISADIPQPAPFTEISYDQWEAIELKNPRLIPDAYFIAKDRDKYVGLSVVWKSETEPKSLYQGNTGVVREYRGRGVAMALKLRVIDYALKHGYEKVKTWNASNNAAMLGVNTKLGFKRQIGWIVLEKNFG